jgi:hypothetical protein
VVTPPRVIRRVACGQQADAAAVGQRLVGLLGAGDLGPDPRRPAAADVGRQPVVPKRPGAGRQREERLVEQVGHLDGVLTGQRVAVGHRD